MLIIFILNILSILGIYLLELLVEISFFTGNSKLLLEKKSPVTSLSRSLLKYIFPGGRPPEPPLASGGPPGALAGQDSIHPPWLSRQVQIYFKLPVTLLVSKQRQICI